MVDRRYLRRVIERKPKPFYETDMFLGTRMVGIHIVETLECGHVRDAFPQCDPLTAKYRVCGACAQSATDAPKKPAASERVMPRWRKLAS